jgi:hypothetical protein
MNVNRDGQGRHRITKGTINYFPNRFDKLHYTKEAEGGYADYPQKVSGIKARTKGPKFDEYYNQATMFYNSLQPHEQAHLAAAISFELSHCDDPLVYENYTKVSRLVFLSCAASGLTRIILDPQPHRPRARQAGCDERRRHRTRGTRPPEPRPALGAPVAGCVRAEGTVDQDAPCCHPHLGRLRALRG